jgi:hypothetical protein
VIALGIVTFRRPDYFAQTLRAVEEHLASVVDEVQVGWLEGIGEVNPQKVGRYTVTGIPIISESAMRECTHLLVLPWHLRRSVIEREQRFLADGGHLIFPLPEIEIVSQ